MRWTTLLALFLLLPGCLEDSPADGGEGGDDTDDEGRQGRTGRGAGGNDGLQDPDAIYHYEDSFGLTVNMDALVSVSVGGVSEGNCVLFWDTNGADYSLVNGTATLEWDALTPLAETLSIYVTSGAGASTTGTSPLTMPIEAMSADNWGVGFAADAPLGSVAAQQAVKLSLAFDYQGDLPSPGIGSCSNGL